MTQEYVIIDASVKCMDARNPLQESLFYIEEQKWVKDFNKAKKFIDSNSAIEIARKLNIEIPVKVLLVQNEGTRIGVGEIKF